MMMKMYHTIPELHPVILILQDSDKKTLSDADIHDAIIAHMRAIQAPFEKLKKAYLANRVNRAVRYP